MAIHRDLPDSELHEPKGVASASAGTVYVADGSATGQWRPLNPQDIIVTDSTVQLSGANVNAVLLNLIARITALEAA